ncbi:MAG: O-antigen ligase family protein [Candidatus Thiodiazotropha sp.]
MISLPNRVTELFGQIGLICGAIYLMVLPLGHVTAIRSISIVLALGLATLLWMQHEDKRLPLAPLFVVWFSVAGLSLFTTVDFPASVDAINYEVVRSALVYFIFFTLAQRLGAFPVFSWATIVNAFILTGLAVQTVLTNHQWVHGYLPALGDYATTAITLIPLLAVATRNERRLLRGAAFFALAGLVLGGYLTHSRGFWLTLICAGVAAVAVRAYHRRRLHWKPVIALMVIGAISVGMAAKVAGVKGRSLGYFDDRSIIYTSVAQKLGDNPFTGTGYGHETDHLWYQTIPDMGPRIYHAHNIVLSYLDQMGPLGLVVLFAIFGVPTIFLLRRLNLTGALPYVSAGFALLVAVFVKNSLDYFFTGANLWLFFAHLGIFTGLLHRMQSAQSGDTCPESAPQPMS